jgi:anti-sigma regulatory factor (Ser/Thr protein kinase)
MRLVGTQALGATRVTGAVVVPSVGDLTAVVRPLVRALAHALARVALFALRTCRPLVDGFAAALRVRPVIPLAGAARVAANPPAGGPPLVAQAPMAQDAAMPSLPAADEPAVPGLRHEVALPADPTAPRRARALLRAAIEDWDLDDDLYQDAAMVVTELVANAVDHAGTPSTLSVGLDDRGLHLAVRDSRPDRAPRPRPVDPTAPRGRGLQMIDALTVTWGVTLHTDGKTVWAVLGRDHADGA